MMKISVSDYEDYLYDHYKEHGIDTSLFMKLVELLADCYRNSLQIAVDQGIRSVAFPSISTGVYSFPKDKAAGIALRAVNQFVEANPGKMHLIEWVLFDDDTLSVYKDALSKLQISKIVGTPMLDSINMMLRDGLV